MTLAEAKQHLKVDWDTEDDLITSYVNAAVSWVENFTFRQLITATYVYYLDQFPTAIRLYLPKPKLQSITSVQYYDENAALQTFASSNYYTDNTSAPGKLVVKSDSYFPSTETNRPNAVIITYTAGYGDDSTDVPEPLRQAIRMLVGSMYENRQEEVTGTIISSVARTAEQICWPYRVMK